MSFRLGKVVNVTPAAHTVDLIMLDTGDRIPNVPVMAPDVSTASGRLSLPHATNPAQPYDVQDTGKTDVIAVVVFAGTMPLVLGFHVPEIGQMTFEDGRRIDRHDSDVYSSTDSDANFEKAWPNGLFMRVGASPAHEDLTGQDFDKLWKITKNTGVRLYVTLQLPNGKGVTIDPDGNITSSSPDWLHTGDMSVEGSVSTTENLSMGNGASGQFTTPTGRTVTVEDGLVTNIT